MCDVVMATSITTTTPTTSVGRWAAGRRCGHTLDKVKDPHMPIKRPQSTTPDRSVRSDMYAAYAAILAVAEQLHPFVEDPERATGGAESAALLLAVRDAVRASNGALNVVTDWVLTREVPDCQGNKCVSSSFAENSDFR